MLIIRRSFAWKTRRWSWPRENGNWRNSLKKTGGKFLFLSLSLFYRLLSSMTNTFGIANIISVILSWSSSYSSFSFKNHPYMGSCFIGYYQDQTHGYDQGQEGGGIELKQSNKCCHWILPIVICETLLHFLFQVAFLQSEYESFSVKITSFEGQRVGKLAVTCCTRLSVGMILRLEDQYKEQMIDTWIIEIGNEQDN